MNTHEFMARAILKLDKVLGKSLVPRSLFAGRSSYESRELIDAVIAKNVNFRDSIQGLEFTLEYSKILTAIGFAIQGKELSSTVRVLDFGGGGGHCYWMARRFFPQYHFEWHVIETEKLCEEADLKLSNKNLKFFSDIEKIRNVAIQYDLIFANSSIQYTKHPLRALAQILKLSTRILFITRTPLAHGLTDYEYSQVSIASQNGPGSISDDKPRVVSYVCTAVPKNLVIDEVKKSFPFIDVFYEGKWDGKSDKIGTYSIIGRT